MDLEPEAKVTVLALRDGAYVLEAEIRAGHLLTVSRPLEISFDPCSLAELE